MVQSISGYDAQGQRYIGFFWCIPEKTYCIILLFLQHFTAYTDANFWLRKNDSLQNGVSGPVTLIFGTDEWWINAAVYQREILNKQ